MAESQGIFFRIPPSGLDDLATAAAHKDKLLEIVKSVANAEINRPRDLIVSDVARGVGLPTTDVAKILDALASLRALTDRMSLTVGQIVTGVDSSIRMHATENWRTENLKNWEDAKDSFVAALNAMPAESALSVQQKARELTYAHQHIMTDASLVTDLRPVYNAAGDKINAFVLTHALTLNYQGDTTQQRIEFALDAGDVIKLFKIAERAQIKMEAARRTFATLGLSLIIPGAVSTKNVSQ